MKGGAKKILTWGAVLLGVFLIFGGVGKVGAVTINPGIPPSTGTNEADPAGIIANIYQFALMISGLLALGAIVYGAILYTISAGNSSRQSDAKQWIYQALIGLGLLAAGALILATINPKVFTLTPGGGGEGGVLKIRGIDSLTTPPPRNTNQQTNNTCPPPTGQAIGTNDNICPQGPQGLTLTQCNALYPNGGFCHREICYNKDNYLPGGIQKGSVYGCKDSNGTLICSSLPDSGCADISSQCSPGNGGTVCEPQQMRNL